MSASLDLLVTGYADDRVASTVVLVRDGPLIAVIDPGMVTSPAAILDPMAALQIDASDVTDVVFSHHHPDHTLNAALFSAARFHDHQAIYHRDVWQDRAAEGFHLSESVWLIETPGHTPQDVTTLVATRTGLIACTHLWWSEQGPLQDPFAQDPEVLRASRQRVLGLRPALVVPGHGPAFAPGPTTPL